MFDSEHLQAEITEQELKYTAALNNHDSYSTLKEIKERIRALKATLLSVWRPENNA